MNNTIAILATIPVAYVFIHSELSFLIEKYRFKKYNDKYNIIIEDAVYEIIADTSLPQNVNKIYYPSNKDIKKAIKVIESQLSDNELKTYCIETMTHMAKDEFDGYFNNNQDFINIISQYVIWQIKNHEFYGIWPTR